MITVKSKKISANNCKVEDVVDVTYIDCYFKDLVMSDLTINNVIFSNCVFDRIIIENSSLTNIRFTQSQILSLTVRGEREISRKRLFGKKSKGVMKNVNFDGSNSFEDVQFSKNLQFNNCHFPESSNLMHLTNPHKIYLATLAIIKNEWKGKKRSIGLKEVEMFYLGKNVENQNEDFITFLPNTHLDKETNEIIRDVFDLIKTQARASKSNP